MKRGMTPRLAPDRQRASIALVVASGLAMAGVAALGGCASQGAGTIGPYDPAAFGRTDCAFSVKVENGGRCPLVPIPTVAVPGVAPANPPPTTPPDKGCGAWTYASNGFVCPPPDTAPGEEWTAPPTPTRYCYKTLGAVECYDRPSGDPQRKPLAVHPAPGP